MRNMNFSTQDIIVKGVDRTDNKFNNKLIELKNHDLGNRVKYYYSI